MPGQHGRAFPETSTYHAGIPQWYWESGERCDDEAVSWADNSTERATVQMAGIAMLNAAHKHAVRAQQ